MQRIKNLIAHPLFSGTTVMIFGSTVVSFINYLYHLVMGRLLGPSDYGVLASIVSLVGLISIIPTSLGLVITKFTSSYTTDSQVGNLLAWFNKKVFLGGLLTSLMIIILSVYISDFLKINVYLLILAGASFLFSIPSILNKATLQGVLKFNQLVVCLLMENGAKLFLGIILVLIGLSINGSIMAILLAAFIGWLVSLFFIKTYHAKGSNLKLDIKPIVLFSLPVLVQSIAITSLYSSDLILVKHFFSSFDTGIYAAVSFLGRIIFFAISPIAAVLLPLVSRRKSLGQVHTNLFYVSLIGSLALGLLIVLIYFLFPNLVISLLYGNKYLPVASYLGIYGIFMILVTLSYLMINFYLAIGKSKIVYLSLVAALAQIIGIVINHQNLSSVIFISLTDGAFLTLGLSGYFVYIQGE